MVRLDWLAERLCIRLPNDLFPVVRLVRPTTFKLVRQCFQVWKTVEPCFPGSVPNKL